jgi:hypothetical protein
MDIQRSLCGGRSSGATKRIGALALFAPCVLAAFAVAGCGGSSSGADLGPAAKFLGRWERDTPTMFAVTCTQVSGTFNPWTELQFERGVLSDASETSTVCTRPSGLAFDVDKTGAALALTAPDPYTGAAPDCAIDLGPDANGLPVYLDLTFTSFDFTLLAVVKDKAPTAILSLAATGVIAQDDGTGTNTYVQVDTCNYTGTNDTYHRMSQP